MRISSVLLSVMLHAGILAGGLITFSGEPDPSESSTMIMIPLELVTVGDVTDITPVGQEAPPASPEEDKTMEAAAASPSPPPAPEDTVALDEAKKPPRDEPRKNEAKPAPASREEFTSVLDGILAGVATESGRKPAPAAASAASAGKEAPRMGAGEQRRMVVSITDYIRAQLVNNRCWTDHSDMADAGRLSATFRVWFARNGKFARAYELQSREPSGDPQLQVFVAHARRALDMCNTIGWIVPEEYFRLPQPQYIDITFVPKIGASGR